MSIATILAAFGYTLLLLLQVQFLAVKWFEGRYMGPLAIVAVLHLTGAGVLAWMVWKRWISLRHQDEGVESLGANSSLGSKQSGPEAT